MDALNAWRCRDRVPGCWFHHAVDHETKTEDDKPITDATEQRKWIVAVHSFHLLVFPSLLTLLPVRVGLSSRNLVDLDANGDRALLSLQHNQVVIVGNILDGSFEQASARNDAQSNECSHDVDFAVCKAIIGMWSA